ncbi:putative lipoprotein [Streptococcus oralis]|nr:putative lipoprotein [Streptococcus oralis]
MVHVVLCSSSSRISFSCSQSYPQIVDKKTFLKTSFSKIQLLDLEAFTLNTPLSNSSVLGFLLAL